MKRLRTYYERELATLFGFNQEYARQFPAQAETQGMVDGAGGGDPHIMRFIQASALSNARTAQLIDDNDVKMTEAVLGVSYPHYARPFPAAAIVCVDADADGGAATRGAATTIPRGTMMSCELPNEPVCKFRTAFDVRLAPVALSGVAFHPIFHLPPDLRQPPAVTASLSFDIACTAGSAGLAQAGLNTLRLFIDAEQSLCAATRDILFLHAQSAYLELPGADGWIALPGVPLLPVGFAPADALLPSVATAHPAYRLLTEYFVFPEKFNFIDIDLAALAPHLPPACRKLTLHLGLSDVAPDSPTARRLATLSSQNFVPRCTPVINLFKCAARPIELTHTAPDYELIADASPAYAYDIHSVDKVYTVRDARHGHTLTEFRPYYSLRHGEAGGKRGHYYLVRRDPIKAQTDPGHETRISLVDLDLDPMAIANASVSIDLTCTNRDLPSRLRYGAAGGDLHLEQVAGGFPLRFLRRPTPQYRFPIDAHWRLISHLTLNHCSLLQDGAAGLKEMLTLYDLPQSSISARQIAGIAGLEHRPARTWLHDGCHSNLVHGIEIRLTLDEDAYAGTGLHLFAQVLDHFFGLYVHLNSYAQLTVLSSASGKELIRCPPRNGARNLL